MTLPYRDDEFQTSGLDWSILPPPSDDCPVSRIDSVDSD
jgi:hypothetical protein